MITLSRRGNLSPLGLHRFLQPRRSAARAAQASAMDAAMGDSQFQEMRDLRVFPQVALSEGFRVTRPSPSGNQ
jgi:hypothetical protein